MTRFWFGPPILRNGPTFDYFDAPNQSAMLLDLRSVPQCAAATPQGFCLFATPNAVNLGADYENLGTDPEAPWGAQAKLRWRSALGLPNPISGNNLRRVLWETITVQSDPIGDDRVKPLDCTVARRFEVLILGNVIDHKRFNAADEEATPLIDMLKRTYRAARQDSLNGVTQPNHYKKVLGFWIKKYGVPYRMLQPPDLPDEEPVEPTTTLSDDFNRADSTTLGSPWTEVTGNTDIFSNQAQGQTNASKNRYDSDISSADHYAQITMVNGAGTGRGSGPAARFASAATTFYFFLSDGSRLFKCVTGTLTALTTAISDPANGSVLKCEINGSSLKGYDDGVNTASVTDTAIAGGTRGGFYIDTNTPTKTLADDWSAADLSAAGIIYTQIENTTRGVARGMWTRHG